jgi:16S rRNA processing protein RimM
VEGLVAIGKVRTSHGLRGEVKVHSYSGVWSHFEALKEVTLEKGAVQKVLVVESTRWSGDNLLLKFRGIDQPEAAKLLADFEFWVPKELAAPLEEGEVYLKDLIGCQVVHEGKVQGTVTSFLEGGHVELLEVVKTDGSKAVLPFEDRYVGTIDLTGRTVELRVEWILD